MRTLAAFSLTELVIVVVIVGTIAAIAVPRLSRAVNSTQEKAVAHDLHQLIEAAERYKAEHGGYPPLAAANAIPDEIKAQFQSGRWDGGTPIGGQWKYKVAAGDACVGVFFPGSPPSDETMSAIDAIVDDGNLSTGAFTKLSPMYFWYQLR